MRKKFFSGNFPRAGQQAADAFRGAQVKIIVGDDQFLVANGAQHGFAGVGGEQVIAVGKHDVFTPHGLKARVPGDGRPSVFLGNQAHPAIAFFYFPAKGQAVIQAAILHQDQFNVLIGLLKHTVGGTFQRFFRIIYRNDN